MDDSTIVCECLKVTAREIREAMQNGCTTTTCISEKTEAGTACQQCLSEARDKRFRRRYHLQEDFLS